MPTIAESRFYRDVEALRRSAQRTAEALERIADALERLAGPETGQEVKKEE